MPVVPRMTARGIQQRWVPPSWAKPARLARQAHTTRNWVHDRDKLDLSRPLPHGSVTPEELARIEPGLFLAWNLVQQRWEIWCRREEDGLLPYFVTRVVTHPPNVYRDGVVVKSCPGRPARSARSRDCPPSCRGKYEIPDRRLLGLLWVACAKSGERMHHELDRSLVAQDEAEVSAIEKALTQRTEDIASEYLNQLLGIQQVGYG